jgi:hypothetical protein
MRIFSKDIQEAIRDWLLRRGVDASKNEIKFSLVSAGTTLASGHIHADIEGVELPVKDGPYR